LITVLGIIKKESLLNHNVPQHLTKALLSDSVAIAAQSKLILSSLFLSLDDPFLSVPGLLNQFGVLLVFV